MASTPPELTAVFDVDLAALLVYSGHPIEQATIEESRVALWFPSEMVLDKQAGLMARNTLVEITQWSSIIRRLHTEYYSPSAKSALSARQGVRS